MGFFSLNNNKFNVGLRASNSCVYIKINHCIWYRV
jgi:hypothetical protein